MLATIIPHELSGSIRSVASKSEAHRSFICAAFADGITDITCHTASKDIDATIACLETLGAHFAKTAKGYRVSPIKQPKHVLFNLRRFDLNCGESASTLRFLLPLVCALGRKVELHVEGTLAHRPLTPFYEELTSHGARLSPEGSYPLSVSGQIKGGRFVLPGNISSQFVSGLLMAAPLMEQDLEVLVTEPVESAPYIDLTCSVLAKFGVGVEKTHVTENDTEYLRFYVSDNVRYQTPGLLEVEGDWSNAAFWLTAGALGSGVEVTDLNMQSKQGDRTILAALSLVGARVSRHGSTATAMYDHLRAIQLNVADTPDLVPPLAIVAAFAEGTSKFSGVQRLRLKESDRLQSITAAISALGGRAYIEGDDTLVIEGHGSLDGGSVDGESDHRIVMMAAVAASFTNNPTTVTHAEAIAKSYPTFFEDFRALGGNVELTDTTE